MKKIEFMHYMKNPLTDVWTKLCTSAYKYACISYYYFLFYIIKPTTFWRQVKRNQVILFYKLINSGEIV